MIRFLKNLVHGYEPAILVGALGAGLSAVSAALASGEVQTTLAVLVPIFVGAAIRQLVTPAKRAEKNLELASRVYSPVGEPHEGPHG